MHRSFKAASLSSHNNRHCFLYGFRMIEEAQPHRMQTHHTSEYQSENENVYDDKCKM